MSKLNETGGRAGVVNQLGAVSSANGISGRVPKYVSLMLTH
jgi:hypothetical protein